MTRNYVVIDFETTGLDYREEQITEVALIKYDAEFNEVGSFNSMVKLRKGKTLSEFIKNLTGLTDEVLNTFGISESLAYDIVNKFIDSETIVVAQYAPFDLAFLESNGIVPQNFICTKSLTSQVEPLESSSLVPTCKRLGIQLDNAHRAFSDVRATAELLQYRLKEGKARFIENVLVTSPDRPLNFTPDATHSIYSKKLFEGVYKND